MRRLLLVALPLLLVFALALWRAEGPAPKEATAPPAEFSSGRALVVLRELAGDGVPHPVATAANARVRDRVLARFRALGYETAVQRRFACNAGAVCANVENIIARLPGARRGDAVLMMAHYDSVPAGPGASDDAMGTAALLEIARAVRNEPLRNPVMFLITDGEEAGLLGAEAFAADAALMREVGVVVNVENRGTFGASNMFETSRGNRWLARHLAGALPRPQATSFFYAIYDLLPNDTDVTVFKRAGTAAINFAAIRGVNWYHTPFDDVAHASPRTLQHHGENLLGTLRALANADLAARSSTDATYFDLLGFAMIWWPQEWTLWIAIVSLVLLVLAARRVPPRMMTFGVLTAFTALAVALAAGSGLGALARLRAPAINWAATPLPSVAAMWLAGIAASLFAAALFRKRAEPLPMLYGIAIVWHVIGIALALKMGGAAFLFIVPAVAVTLCALVQAGEVTTASVASVVAAILIFPLGILLYDALGSRLMVAVAILIGCVAMLFAPLFGRMRNAAIALGLAVVCTLIAIALPPFSNEKPRWISLTYLDDPAAPAPQWLTGTLTDPLRKVATFAPVSAALTPWSSNRPFAAVAPNVGLQRATLTREPIDGGTRIRVRSHRGANRITLVFRGGDVLRVNGVPLPPRPPRFRERMPSGWRYASAAGVSELVVDIAAKGAVEAIGSDISFGLPGGEALQRARDASTAIPIQDGDVTITRAR